MPCPLCGSTSATVGSAGDVNATLVQCPTCTGYEMEAAFVGGVVLGLDGERVCDCRGSP